MKRWKILVAALIVAGAAAVPAQATTVLDDMDDFYFKAGMRALRTLKEEYPDEYEKLAAEFVDYTIDGRLESEKQDLIDRAIGDFIRRHAVALRKADPGLILNVIESKRNLLVTVLLSEQGQACTRWLYAPTQTPGLKENAWLYADTRDREIAAIIRAIASGERTPVGTSASVDEDWGFFIKQYLANGGTVAELLQMPLRPANLCETKVKFLRAMSQIPGVEGQRLRAEYIYTSSW